MRQIVFDTETTGIDPGQGHRIIEIGAAEIENRRLTGRVFHQFLQPDREIDEGAVAVHGIGNEDLKTEPRFPEVAEALLDFIRGAELIIHNAPFDVGFLEHELVLMRHPQPTVAAHCTVLDTLAMARAKHPGQRNSLDALCRRYNVDNSNRDVHGALLDARLLADVYFAMTGGQASLVLDAESGMGALGSSVEAAQRRMLRDGLEIRVVRATDAELELHEKLLQRIDEESEHATVWRRPPADG